MRNQRLKEPLSIPSVTEEERVDWRTWLQLQGQWVLAVTCQRLLQTHQASKICHAGLYQKLEDQMQHLRSMTRTRRTICGLVSVSSLYRKTKTAPRLISEHPPAIMPISSELSRTRCRAALQWSATFQSGELSGLTTELKDRNGLHIQMQSQFP